MQRCRLINSEQSRNKYRTDKEEIQDLLYVVLAALADSLRRPEWFPHRSAPGEIHLRRHSMSRFRPSLTVVRALLMGASLLAMALAGSATVSWN